MGGTRCSYVGCEVSNRRDSNVRLYRFPRTNDMDRLQKWIVNSGNTRLLAMYYLNPETLNNYTLCQNHFKDVSFVNQSKHRITKIAVPVPSSVEDSLESCGLSKLPINSILCNKFYKRHFSHEFYVRQEHSECLINE